MNITRKTQIWFLANDQVYWVAYKLSLVVECNKNYKNDDWTDRQPDIKRAPLLPKCAVEEYREQKKESSDIKKKTDSKM